MTSNGKPVELVKLTIDGRQVEVPKGTNVIEAARTVGIEIPHYCYHPHLSVAGNCRICQVRVKGLPKLEIACNMAVREGMEVSTHLTSKEVADAQAAVLEFILINHPLDCTVCDQAGHCKLQDYHYEYNARPSRFLEDKVHKVKAEPLGPNVILDGERCIMCTRCIRFCDEITETSELGMLNRGDRSMIAINQNKPLENALSGTVVDLCPVGALTHRPWRFNTRIWFTKETDSICPGCSTGCNVKVAERDKQVVQVKARLNAQVNKEWLCDEGRYGFNRFLPAKRVTTPFVDSKEVTWEAALAEAAKLASRETLVFISPDLLLEEFSILKLFLEKVVKNYKTVLAYRERTLSKVQAILVSPDYAANFRAAEFSGLVAGNLEGDYNEALKRLRNGSASNVLIVGERGILAQDVDDGILSGLSKAALSVALLTDASSPPAHAARVVLPGRSILEKAGLMINRASRLQYGDRVVEFPDGTEPEWRLLNRIAEKCGGKLVNAKEDREATLWLLASEPRLAGLRIATIKNGGICLKSYTPQAQASGAGVGAR